MDLNQFWVFYHVAKFKSFSLAADALFVTRPLISIRIRQLEETYKIRLFERSGRKVELTNAGEVLFEYADRAFSIIKDANSHMEDMKGFRFGKLKISSGLTVGTYYLPPLLAAFQQKYPNIEIQMKVKNKKEVIDDILSFRDDLGFVGNMEPVDNLVMTSLWEEELVVIVPPSHEFTELKTFPLSKLNEQPLILREKGSGTRELIEKKLRKEQISVRVVMELGSDEAIKRAVEVGLGMSIVPTGVVKKEVRRGLIKAIRISKEKVLLTYSMIYHKDKYISHIIKAFINMALEDSRPDPLCGKPY